MFVYVDDTDTAIHYGEGWNLESGVDFFEGYGAPLYATLHGTNSTTEFSFSFSGTHVAVFLLSQAGMAAYNCTIDEMPFSLVVTNLPILSSSEAANLSPGDMATCYGYLGNDGKQHELKVTVSGSQKSPVFLDYIQYTPTQTITTADFSFPPGDSSIKIGPTNFDTFALLPGSTLDFTFTGYSATVRGAFDNKTFSNTPSSVSYTIDGGSPVNFTIINSATTITPLLNNQVLIQTPRYPLGQHTLHIEFLGTNETVPLVPTDFVVQNQTSHIDLSPIPVVAAQNTNPSSTSPASSPTSSSPPSMDAPNHSSNHTVVLGIALGTVALISVLLLAIVLVRRKSKVAGDYIPHDLLGDIIVHPFNHNNTGARTGNAAIRKNTPRSAGTGNGSSLTSGNANANSRPQRKVVVHVDSGSRVPQPGPGPGPGAPETPTPTQSAVELPPTYENINHGTV